MQTCFRSRDILKLKKCGDWLIPTEFVVLSCTPLLIKNVVLIEWSNDSTEDSYATSWETTPCVLEVLSYNICYVSWTSHHIQYIMSSSQQPEFLGLRTEGWNLELLLKAYSQNVSGPCNFGLYWFRIFSRHLAPSCIVTFSHKEMRSLLSLCIKPISWRRWSPQLPDKVSDKWCCQVLTWLISIFKGK